MEKIAFETISKFWNVGKYKDEKENLSSISGVNSFYDLLKIMINQDLSDSENIYFTTCFLYSEVKREFENLTPSELIESIRSEFLKLGGKL